MKNVFPYRYDLYKKRIPYRYDLYKEKTFFNNTDI